MYIKNNPGHDIFVLDEYTNHISNFEYLHYYQDNSIYCQLIQQ